MDGRLVKPEGTHPAKRHNTVTEGQLPRCQVK